MKVLFEDKFIIIVEKPADVLSEPDGKNPDIVTLASEHVCKPCFLVHRLDRNTGGAMVLSKMQKATGKLSEAIQKREFEKEYIAVIKGEISRPEILKLQSGVIIDGSKTAPSKVAVVDMSEHTVTLSVIIHEGRNRQVRKMFEAIDKEVIRLTRIRMGELYLGNLAVGESRELNRVEISYINRLK